MLDRIGVEVDGETNNDYLCFCPFHGNRATPSFSVGKYNGKYICFNASCSVYGSLQELVEKIGKLQPFPAKRLILKFSSGTASVSERLSKQFEEPASFIPFSQDVLDRMGKEFFDTPAALEYMKGRGFEEETLHYFGMGYSYKKDMLAVPMHDPDGIPIGVVGRSLVDKQFKNSAKLPVSKTMWNFHRAKRTGDSVIVVEASFDAMRLHQAGFPNVVAILGGNFSRSHMEQIDRTFNTVILMTDFDDKEKYIYDRCKKCARRDIKFCRGHNPGRDLADTIAEKVGRKRVLYASYDNRMVYPEQAKDAGDMSDDQIRRCVKNAVSRLEYSRWGLY